MTGEWKPAISFRPPVPENEGERSWDLRLGVGIYKTKTQPPPWHDEWSIKMDETALNQLSAELLSLPDPLPPRLRQLRELAEKVVTSGHAEWHHGLHPKTLAEQ